MKRSAFFLHIALLAVLMHPGSFGTAGAALGSEQTEGRSEQQAIGTQSGKESPPTRQAAGAVGRGISSAGGAFGALIGIKSADKDKTGKQAEPEAQQPYSGFCLQMLDAESREQFEQTRQTGQIKWELAQYLQAYRTSPELQAYDVELLRTWQQFQALFAEAEKPALRNWCAFVPYIYLDPEEAYVSAYLKKEPLLPYMKKVLELARKPDARLAFALSELQRGGAMGVPGITAAEEVVFVLDQAERGSKEPFNGYISTDECELRPDGVFRYVFCPYKQDIKADYSLREDSPGVLIGRREEETSPIQNPSIVMYDAADFMKLENGRISFIRPQEQAP